ncbi:MULTISPECIES: hypothetical protein [Streptomyces]|uniref:Uncharacterized protein n=2 Tax=Streptomyces TaxID=1883 RepID=A0ABV9J9G8_9ACTN
MSRLLLAGAFLSATVALGTGPSYAAMSPEQAGISDSDWAKVAEIGDYNHAYTAFIDNSGEATLVFTGGNVPDELQWPSDFTGFDNPNLELWGEYSQFATNDAIASIADDTVLQISNAGYDANASYNPDTDVIDVITNAPSSVTGPLVATYGSTINIIAGNPTQQSGSGGTAHGSPKKHAPHKHATKKQAAKKQVTRRPAAAKKAAPSTSAPQEPTKVILKLANPQ